MVLHRAEDLREQALSILHTQRRRLQSLGVEGELVLVGGSSVAGALTKGDVDLHLRVPTPAFTRTWRLIAADPSLLAQYNAIKIAHYGAATERYEAHKSVFFDRLVGRSPGTGQAD